MKTISGHNWYEQYSQGEDEEGNKVKYIDEIELKAEAVKWVKIFTEYFMFGYWYKCDRYNKEEQK